MKMNERINKLVEETEKLYIEWRLSPGMEKKIPSLIEEKQFMYEKFAELIVKRIIDNVECHASLFNTKEARQVCSWIVKSVKYDFGVE